MRVEDPVDRQFATFCLAITVTTLALGAVGGDNFTATPVNLEMWSFFGAAISLAVNSRLADVPIRPSMRAIMQKLEATGPKIPMAARAALVQQEA